MHVYPHRRTWVGPLLLGMAGLTCLLLAAWAWKQNRTWPERAVIPLADPLANLNQSGVNVELLHRSPTEIEAILAQVQAAGFRWVRQRFPWSELEPQRGTLRLATADAIVAACAAHDLRLIALLDDAPSWARVPQEREASIAPPREVSDWGDFVHRLAARYRGQIAAYQLWDEPNLAAHWGGRYVNPTDYALLLREGAARVRDADPGATVLLAALAPTVENGPLNLNEVAFLQGVIAAGGASFFDAVALQPYGFAQPPSVAPDPTRLNFARPAWVRRAMVRLGLGNRPAWIVAGGWNSPPTGEGTPGPWPMVSEEEQARYTLEALTLVRHEWPWIGPVILYTFRPDLPADDPRWGFSLTDRQGNPRSVAAAWSEYNATSHPLPVGDYAAASDLARYVGEWRFSSAGADPPRNADVAKRNAVISFDFDGSALDLQVRRGNFWGLFYVSVDGRPATGLPRDEEGRAYLVLYDPDDGVEWVNIAHDLNTQAPHHLEIVAHGGWGQWPLLGWRVRREQTPPPGRGIVWGLGVVGSTALAIAVGYAVLRPASLEKVYLLSERVFRWYRTRPEWLPVATTLSTALTLYLVPWGAVAWFLLVLLFLLFLLRIDLGLATVAVAIPFYLRPKAISGHFFSPLELSLGVCLAAWLTALLLDIGRRSLRVGPQALLARLWQSSACLRTHSASDRGMMALTLVAAVSQSWAAHAEVARHEFRTLFLESALFYALLRLAARSTRARRRVREGWLLGALLIALVGLWQLAAGRNLIAAEGTWRVRGLYGSPNNLALYLERALPVLAAVAWLGEEKRQRVVHAVAALPVLIALLTTFSKGALLLGLPAVAFTLTVGAISSRRRLLWGTIATLSVLVTFLSLLALTGRLHALLDWSAGSGFFRLKVWRSAVMMIADHPLTGVGPDNFLYAYRSRYVLPSAWGELNLSHPHNLLLDAWTRLGIGGVIALGWLIISFFRITRAQLRVARGERRAVSVGLLAAMAATLAHGLVDHAIFVVDLAFVFALLLALAHPPSR